MTSSRSTELTQLLRKATSGDQAALDALCRGLEDQVRGFFVRKFSDSAIVDDLCQETYMRFIKSFTHINDQAKLTGFVTKVAFHVMQDHLRKKYREREEDLEEHHDGAPESGEPRLKTDVASESQDEEIISKLDLEDALSQLPGRSREILLLTSQGYNYVEIAEQVGISVSGVKMQVKRSLELLREILSDVTFCFVASTLLIEAFRRILT